MQQMMDALVKEHGGPGLSLKRVPIPNPGIGEVQIKIHKTAICGTDVHIYNWDSWSQQHIHTPMVIGHEYVGEITCLGPGVTDYAIGDIVSGEGHIVCGHCRNCRAGNGQWCKFTRSVGVDRDGAFAEYLCIPGNKRNQNSEMALHIFQKRSFPFLTLMETLHIRLQCSMLSAKMFLITGLDQLA